MKHYLKTWPKYFVDVKEGRKKFEIREDDRGFQMGDILILQEYDPKIKKYTGEEVSMKVIYITDFAQKEKFVVLGIENEREQ